MQHVGLNMLSSSLRFLYDDIHGVDFFCFKPTDDLLVKRRPQRTSSRSCQLFISSVYAQRLKSLTSERARDHREIQTETSE